MHEHGGFFCKTVNSTDNAKIAGQEKNMHGPNLTSPIEERPGGLLTLGLGPVRWRGWAAAGEAHAGAVLAGQAAPLLVPSRDMAAAVAGSPARGAGDARRGGRGPDQIRADRVRPDPFPVAAASAKKVAARASASAGVMGRRCDLRRVSTPGVVALQSFERFGV